MAEALTPDQRVALVERLERQDAERRSKALRTAWGSVGVAAVVLAGIVFAGWWQASHIRADLAAARKELDAARHARNEVAREVDALKQKKAELDAELQWKQSQLTASLGALGRVDETQRRAAVERQISEDPKTAALLPRVYLHIVDRADREWATGIGRRLEAAGMIALGVQYVPEAANLKASDVRFYKKAEEPGASRIAAVLRDAGVEAKLNYLNLENSTKVKPNHFEVWFAAGASGASPPPPPRTTSGPYNR